jgi:hypothetical protein
MALTALDRKIVAAAADTLFPRGGAIDVDGTDAGVVAYVDDYLERLPSFERLKLLAFFRAFDVGLAWSTKRPGARFHTADPQTRRDYLAEWENGNYTRRMGYQGLRMVLTFAYTESPAVKAAMKIDREPPFGAGAPA